MALLLSLSEVWILSSIKPFIESFSTINIKDLGDSDLNNYKNTINGAYEFLFIVILCGILRVSLIFFQYRSAAAISAAKANPLIPVGTKVLSSQGYASSYLPISACKT